MNAPNVVSIRPRIAQQREQERLREIAERRDVPPADLGMQQSWQAIKQRMAGQ